MYKILFIFIFMSFRAESQVLFLDKLIAKLYYTNAGPKKKDPVAFVLNREPGIITAKKMSETEGFDLIFFDRDSLFIEYLRRNPECYLIRLKVLKKNNDSMQVRIMLGSTNYEAYTNPNGNILGDIDDRIIVLRSNKKSCIWE